MKKILLAVLLVLSMTVMSYAQSSDTGFAYDIRMGFGFPFIDINSISSNSGGGVSDMGNLPIVSLLLGGALTSLSFGGGVQYTFFPHLLAPGVYFDLNFNLPSWFFVWAFSGQNLVLFQYGAHIYNQFRINKTVSFDPFFGFNFVTFNLMSNVATVTCMKAGMLIRLGSFGLEYAYNFGGNFNQIRDFSIHRLTFTWSLVPKKET